MSYYTNVGITKEQEDKLSSLIAGYRGYFTASDTTTLYSTVISYQVDTLGNTGYVPSIGDNILAVVGDATRSSFYFFDGTDWVQGADALSLDLLENDVSNLLTSNNIIQQDVNSLITGYYDGATTTILDTNANVYADGQKGMPDPTGITSGWHFKNTDDITNKVNWYYVGNTNPNVNFIRSNFNNQYAVVDVRAGLSPYFVLYTVPEGDGNDAAAWFRSRVVYAPTGYDISAYVGQTIVLYWGQEPSLFLTLPRVECTFDSFSSVGPQGANELVSFGNLSTSSSYPEASYDFVVSNLGFTLDNAEQKYELVATPTVSAGGASGPDYSNGAYIILDAVNDYVALTNTGSVLDYTSTWAIGISLEEVSALNNSQFMSLFRSGNNSISLRKGGTNWGIYAANGYYSVAQANTWYAPSQGSKILIQCNGNKLEYWLDGTRRANMTMNATYRDQSSHVNDSLDIGHGGVAFGQGTHQYWEGGIDNCMISYNWLSNADIAEFFSSDDVTQMSFYNSVRDFVPMGEQGYPNVVGTKNNVTGTLVNGTAEDFIAR